MDETLRKVEAVLFAVGKEISVERIATLCQLETSQVQETLETLQQIHQESAHSMQLIERDGMWKLTVEDSFIPLVSSLVHETELEVPLQQTLAVIAWRYPVVQSEVVKLRGSSAYEHMKSLQEMGFIAKEKYGRTYKLKLTQKFFNYFDLPSESTKQAFLDQIPAEVLAEAEAISQEADEVERLTEQQEKVVETTSEIEKALTQAKQQ